MTRWSHWNAIDMAIHWQDCYFERRLEEVLWQEGWDKVPGGEWLYVHRHAQLFLSENVDDTKMAGRSNSLAPM